MVRNTNGGGLQDIRRDIRDREDACRRSLYRPRQYRCRRAGGPGTGPGSDDCRPSCFGSRHPAHRPNQSGADAREAFDHPIGAGRPGGFGACCRWCDSSGRGFMTRYAGCFVAACVLVAFAGCGPSGETARTSGAETPEALYRIGHAYYLDRNLDSAAATLTRAYALDSTSVPLLTDL